MTDIMCRNHDIREDELELFPTCEKTASTFVRIIHSGRLSPLCKACKLVFEIAERDLLPDARERTPGHGKYEVVSLADGSDEFSKQPPKQRKSQKA